MSARLALFAVLALAGVAAADPIKRTSDPAISPDGQTIAFAWQGDIWTVPTAGGPARRLTVHPADDMFPKWSRDGKTLAFSSERYGSLDIFTMTRDGGGLRRVTHSSSDEYAGDISPDGKWIIGYTNAFGRLDLFKVNARGGDPISITRHPLEMEYYGVYSPDGRHILYNTSGSPGHWRYAEFDGSNTSEIWLARDTEPVTEHRPLFQEDYYALFPVFAGSDRVAYVANPGGVVNVYSRNLSGGGERKHTNHTGGTIRSLSSSADGSTLAYQHNSEIWVWTNDRQPARRVEITAPADAQRDPVQFVRDQTASDMAISPDGRRLAFISRGNLFITPSSGGPVRRLTDNPGQEASPLWLSDDKILYVGSQEDATRELRVTDLEGKSDNFLTGATDIQLPEMSPDGKWIAAHDSHNNVIVMPAEGGQPKIVARGAFWPVYFGARQFSWSPDSKWLVTIEGVHRGYEARIHNVESGESMVVARAAKGLNGAVFSGDGKSVVFVATNGLDFSETRIGNVTALYAVDLYPRPVTFEEDKLDRMGEAPAKKEEPTVRVMKEGLKERVRKLSPTSVSGLWQGPTPTTVWAMMGGQLMSVPVAGGAARPVPGVTGPVFDIKFTKNRQTAYMLMGNQRIMRYTVAASRATPVSFTAEQTINMRAEEMALFAEIWWLMDRMFYDDEMRGKDWPAVRREFAELLPYAQSRSDFYDLMNEMVYRLDSSHQGANIAGSFSAPAPDSTAWLGVSWKSDALANGRYVVDEVSPGSPADHPDMMLLPGDQLMRVNGMAPSAEAPLSALLNRKAGRKVVLDVRRGTRDVKVTIKPASIGALLGSHYADWVRWNRDYVSEKSNGQLGYVHIQGMNAASLDRFYTEIVTEMVGKKGAIIDVRYNGGGFTAHIILGALIKTPWLIRTNPNDPETQISENIYRGNSLELPTVAMTNEYSFSNAEIFSEGFRRLGLGEIVGERTGGGVIGTYGWTMWDGGSLRLPASGAFGIDGDDLERDGRRPTINVDHDPRAWARGDDPQLDAAIEALLKSIR